MSLHYLMKVIGASWELYCPARLSWHQCNCMCDDDDET